MKYPFRFYDVIKDEWIIQFRKLTCDDCSRLWCNAWPRFTDWGERSARVSCPVGFIHHPKRQGGVA